MAEGEEKKYKIIITDDDDFLVNMYAVKFSHSGVEVISCKSGQMLVEKLKAGEKANLVLLDIVMPGMDGLETLREIRKQNLAEGVPIVMLTNQGGEKEISEAKKFSISGYIVKSAATPSEVVEEVIKIIQNK